MWTAAILMVSINTGAYMAESVRGGIISIDPGQTEGAKAIGMTHVQTMLHVILPQAIRNILPQIGNNFIINVKDTSVMFIIASPSSSPPTAASVGASYMYFPSRRGEDGRVPHHDADRLLPAALVGKANGWQQRLQAGHRRMPSTMAAGTYSHPTGALPSMSGAKSTAGMRGKREENAELTVTI